MLCSISQKWKLDYGENSTRGIFYHQVQISLLFYYYFYHRALLDNANPFRHIVQPYSSFAIHCWHSVWKNSSNTVCIRNAGMWACTSMIYFKINLSYYFLLCIRRLHIVENDCWPHTFLRIKVKLMHLILNLKSLDPVYKNVMRMLRFKIRLNLNET